MKWLLTNIKNIGLITAFGIIVSCITWIVNLNRDISDLKEKIVGLNSTKIDESRAIFIYRIESADQKNEIKDLWKYLLNERQ